MYKTCKNVKKLVNNVQVEFDTVRQDIFSVYSQQIKQQLHDAGYDSYMTGFSFIAVGKYIEIGKVCMKDGLTIAESKPSSQLAVIASKNQAKTKPQSAEKIAKKDEK